MEAIGLLCGWLAALAFFLGAIRVQAAVEWLHLGLMFVMLWLLL